MCVSVAFVGCGTHAQHHALHLGREASLLGVWDPKPKAARQMPTENRFSSLDALLGERLVEAVMICSPDEFHLDQIEAALAAGKHVFCEKPLLVPGQDIVRLERAFDEAHNRRLVLTSCHPRRYDRPIQWLRDRLDPMTEGIFLPSMLGRVLSFDFDFSYHVPDSAWKRSRSLLLDHVNHEVDTMNALFGIRGFNAMKLVDGFDHYEVVGKRDDGITFHFRGTRRLPTEVYPEWCRVRCEGGTVALDMMLGIARIQYHANKSEVVIDGLAIDYDGRLERVANDFVGCQVAWGQKGYLSRAEMLMNTEAGILLQQDGWQRVNVRA